jgi:ATP-binding cassette subfamily F protein 3
VLGKTSRPEGVSKAGRKADKRAAAEARERYKALQMEVKRTEKILADLMATRTRVDAALFDPASAGPPEKGLTMTELMKRRAELEDAIEAAELSWVEANEALELTEA